jgi:hypothetical protein
VLNLKNNYSLNKEQLAEIRESMPRVHSLDLGFCHTLTEQDFATIVGFDLLPGTKGEFKLVLVLDLTLVQFWKQRMMPKLYYRWRSLP